MALRHFLREELSIGRSPDNDLCIPSLMLSRRHCHFTLRDGVVTVTDAGSTSGTWLNERVIHGACRVEESDSVRIGDWLFRFERELTLDGMAEDELALLEMIVRTPSDEDARSVYSDWLEDRGDRSMEVELLALDRSLTRMVGGEPNPEAMPRRSWLASQIASCPWTCVMTRAPVSGCDVASCVARWEEAAALDGHIQLRRCRECDEDVYYACSAADGSAWMANRRRVAIEP